MYTLVELGHHVSLTEPQDLNARGYIRRANFWSILSQHGFTVPDGWHGYNIGGAAGLIECALITTNAELDENMRSSLLSYDRLRKAMLQAGLHGRDRAASVFAELAGNAAEHSKSQRGAFVAAQAYPQRGLIEIAVADVGIGIRTAFNDQAIQNDGDVIEAALQEGVTGRRDAGGNPAEGGFGLPTAVAESTVLMVRSGRAIVTARADPRPYLADEGITIDYAFPLLGTLVIADVSS